MFYSCRHFNFCLIFEVRRQTTRVEQIAHCWLTVLTANARLGWKRLALSNTLAYLSKVWIAQEKVLQHVDKWMLYLSPRHTIYLPPLNVARTRQLIFSRPGGDLLFGCNILLNMGLNRAASFSSSNRIFLDLKFIYQGTLKGEVSLYCGPPVWLVWNQLYDNWQFLFLFAKQTNPNQSNRRSIVQWYCPL